MTQSKKQSTIETIANVGTGYFLAFGLNLTILPFFVDGISEKSITTAIIIGVIYTGVSMLRSFIFRRAFNGMENKHD